MDYPQGIVGFKEVRRVALAFRKLHFHFKSTVISTLMVVADPGREKNYDSRPYTPISRVSSPVYVKDSRCKALVQAM